MFCLEPSWTKAGSEQRQSDNVVAKKKENLGEKCKYG